MVRALLDGRKTQTRRIVKPQPWEVIPPKKGESVWPYGFKFYQNSTTQGDSFKMVCPYGHPGDRLNVKEHAWMWCEKIPNGKTEKGRPKFKYVPLKSAPIIYCADYTKKPETDVVSEHRGNAWGWRKKLGRFLPAWASRIQLEITRMRVERLNDISENDAKAEGIFINNCADQAWENDMETKAFFPTTAYKMLWESLNGAGSWAENPWVWVIEFKQVAKQQSSPTINDQAHRNCRPG